MTTSPTLRLYHHDPYRTVFEARVLRHTELAGRPAVLLEATCFYPTSGGQPHDTGTLNNVPVVDVVEQDGEILHVLAAPLTEESVRGEVDWARRYDHMQQHSGQHVLSQAFLRELNAATLSFHLGEEACTIDVALASLEPMAAARVEDAANRVVFANRPVTVREYQPGELDALSLRKAVEVEGDVRVVSIGAEGPDLQSAYDVSACCGTHVRATGEIGPIHIRRWERCRNQTRVEFLCGWRAVRHLRALNGICQTLAGRLTVAVADLPEAVQRLEDAADASYKQSEELRRRLMEAELEPLAAQAQPLGNLRVLSRVLEGYDVPTLRMLAQRLVQRPGLLVLLAVREPAPQLLFARSPDVSIDVAALLRQAAGPLGGRGGGTPQLAQGGGVSADDLPRVLDAALALLKTDWR